MPMPAHQETTATVDHLSRRMWRALEPYHALVYFIPETRQRTDALGLKGGWMSYFGTRAAPLGPVPAEVVTALFYHFHPSMVRRAIPDAWSYASPDALTEARVVAAGEGLRRLLGAAVESDAIAEAAELAAAAALATSTAGRAGRAEVEWRTDELMKPTWDALGAERCSRLESLLLPIRAQILGAGASRSPTRS